MGTPSSTVTVHYRKGEGNPADYMSRHTTKKEELASRQERNTSTTSRGIHQLHSHFFHTSIALTLSSIAEATARDPTLRAVIEAVQQASGIK